VYQAQRKALKVVAKKNKKTPINKNKNKNYEFNIPTKV